MNLLTHYKVRHRLPGRIRLYIPALEKLPPSWHHMAEPINELILLKNGIKSVKIEPVSGGVVLNYTPEMICERDVLNWLELIVRRFINLIRRHNNPSRKESLSVLHSLKERLQSTMMD